MSRRCCHALVKEWKKGEVQLTFVNEWHLFLLSQSVLSNTRCLNTLTMPGRVYKELIHWGAVLTFRSWASCVSLLLPRIIWPWVSPHICWFYRFWSSACGLLRVRFIRIFYHDAQDKYKLGLNDTLKKRANCEISNVWQKMGIQVIASVSQSILQSILKLYCNYC